MERHLRLQAAYIKAENDFDEFADSEAIAKACILNFMDQIDENPFHITYTKHCITMLEEAMKVAQLRLKAAVKAKKEINKQERENQEEEEE